MAQMTQQKLHLKLIFLGNIKNSLKTSKVEILGCLLTFFHSVSFFECLFKEIGKLKHFIIRKSDKIGKSES